MKQILTAVLASLAAMAMAAETNLEIKGPRDYTAWGSPKYYQTPPTVTLADGVVKVTCGKTIEGVKPINFQFAVRSAREYKAGTTYTVTFTLKSNHPARTGAVQNFRVHSHHTDGERSEGI